MNRSNKKHNISFNNDAATEKEARASAEAAAAMPTCEVDEEATFYCLKPLVAGISLERYRQEVQTLCDVAGSLMALALNAGLTCGALLSFLIRGLLCGCNPFVGG